MVVEKPNDECKHTKLTLGTRHVMLVASPGFNVLAGPLVVPGNLVFSGALREINAANWLADS